MEEYIEFRTNMKRFAKAEEDKAYYSVLKRFQIRMSELLHDIKPLHDKYVKAAMSRDALKERQYEDKLLVWYRKWQASSEAVLMATIEHLVTKVNDHVAFALDACNYKDDPYDSLFIGVLPMKWTFTLRMKEDQKGKDLLLVGYSARDFFNFYDEVPYRLRPHHVYSMSGEVLAQAPSAKRPRVVPVYKK